MPSTVSSVVSRPFASSTVITPSLPTFSIASAMRSPISLSLFAEIEPTCAISFLPAVGTEIFFRSSTTAPTALSIPRLSAIGLTPAVTFFRPSRKIACASTVAVVVPSPARSEVFVATSFTIRELDLLRDRHAVLGHGRRAKLLVEDDVPSLGAEGDLHRIGKLIDAALERRARIDVEMEFLGSHV